MLIPLSSDEIVDKQLTQFFEGTHGIRRYLAKPYSCWSFKGRWEGLHIISSETPWRYIVVLKVAIWSKGSRHESHHTSPRKVSWTSEARGDRWWKLWKESLFDELNPLRDSPFSCSPSSHPWPSSSSPSPFPSVAPFVKQYPLFSFRAQHFLYLLDSGLVLPHTFLGPTSVD